MDLTHIGSLLYITTIDAVNSMKLDLMDRMEQVGLCGSEDLRIRLTCWVTGWQTANKKMLGAQDQTLSYDAFDRQKGLLHTEQKTKCRPSGAVADLHAYFHSHWFSKLQVKIFMGNIFSVRVFCVRVENRYTVQSTVSEYKKSQAGQTSRLFLETWLSKTEPHFCSDLFFPLSDTE